jgi:hypothetical protein
MSVLTVRMCSSFVLDIILRKLSDLDERNLVIRHLIHFILEM